MRREDGPKDPFSASKAVGGVPEKPGWLTWSRTLYRCHLERGDSRELHDDFNRGRASEGQRYVDGQGPNFQSSKLKAVLSVHRQQCRCPRIHVHCGGPDITGERNTTQDPRHGVRCSLSVLGSV